ncbi:MAG TPA: hypothetical protein DCR84_02610 [Ruminococcaceae bacterium]|nr:hypothetical protein [Oscillospiraceae bacterium]
MCSKPFAAHPFVFWLRLFQIVTICRSFGSFYQAGHFIGGQPGAVFAVNADGVGIVPVQPGGKLNLAVVALQGHAAAVNINGIAFRILVEISADVIAAGSFAQAKAGIAGAVLHLGQLLAFQYGNGNVRVAIHGIGHGKIVPGQGGGIRQGGAAGPRVGDLSGITGGAAGSAACSAGGMGSGRLAAGGKADSQQGRTSKQGGVFDKIDGMDIFHGIQIPFVINAFCGRALGNFFRQTPLAFSQGVSETSKISSISANAKSGLCLSFPLLSGTP